MQIIIQSNECNNGDENRDDEYKNGSDEDEGGDESKTQPQTLTAKATYALKKAKVVDSSEEADVTLEKNRYCCKRS